MQPLNICIFLLCILTLFHNGHGNSRRTKGFLDDVTTCCQHAIKAVKTQNNPDCKAIGQQVESLVPGYVCRSSAELCCVKKIQESLCDKGKNVAINGGSCAAGTALYGTEDQLECCYCCYLGIAAKKRNMGCREGTVFGYPCEKAYLSCCLSADPHPSGIPNMFGTVAPTTSRRTCSSLGCSHSCVVLRNVPTCVCRRGFSLNRNGRTCDDENECTRSGVCDQNEECENTYGSYQCIENVQSSNVSCPSGFQVDPLGKQCQDIDECQGSPCQADEICTNTMGGYQCSPRCRRTYVYRNGRCEKACRRGTVYDGTRCVDVDECQRPGACRSNQRCYNTVGSYRCVSIPVRCRNGYRRDGQNCVDIDECVKYRSRRPCGSRTCVNIPGSYRCVTPRAPSCSQGYELVNSVCKDVNECLRRPCPRNELCVNVAGSYQCNCPRGYTRVGSKCQDIDECRKNLCRADETCINRPGTYRCEKRVSCRPGYRLVGRNCVDVNECENKRRCPADKECINTAGSYQCKVKCSPGYEWDRLVDDCRDINECVVGTPCRSGDEECQNLPGSYRCAKVVRCQSGYERFNGVCQDKDECLVPNICRSPRPNCVNIPGSYRCEYNPCRQGFTRGRNNQCQDIDECSTGQHICKARAERCINLQGTYSCRCNPGYIRTGGDEHCRDEDECRGYGQRCAHRCVNTEGSFRCECRKGYALADATNCIDIDECRQAGTCQHTCFNTQGSYYCLCRRGYNLQSNGRSCIDVNECNLPQRYGKCAYRCQNFQGSFRCLCPRGYRLRYSVYCSDIDECANRNPCNEKSVCFNTYGGYKCVKTKCPNDHFIQRSLIQCTKKQCNITDDSCKRETRKSIRWISRGFPNNVRSGAFKYYYNITTRGYLKPPYIKYSIKGGNTDDAFEIQSRGYGRAVLTNRKVLKGPSEYEMIFVGEVVSKGLVKASFVNKVHVYVSAYDF